MQAQIDGNVVKARFTLPPRQKASPPPKAVAPKRDAPRTDNAGAEVEKDGPKRPRECICLIFVEHFLFYIYHSGGFYIGIELIIHDTSFSSEKTSSLTTKKISCASKSWIS